MPSLYAKYILERTNDLILETDIGFLTYRFLDEKDGSKSLYIIDIYVLPEFRKRYIASELADSVCEKAKAEGCNKVYGTVVPSAKGSTTSLQVLLNYGMTVHSSSPDLIVMKKDL